LTTLPIETITDSDPFMIFRSFKLFLAAVLASLLLWGCGGGSSEPPPTGLKAEATESTITLTWDMKPGVEYIVFYGPTSLVPNSLSPMGGWVSLPGGGTQLNATSPFVVTGLYNGLSYSFSIDARTNGGPGGPGATPVPATPRLAGSSWVPGTAAGSGALRGVAYGTQFVAAGEGGLMYSSADGAAWSAISSPTTANLNAVLYSGNYSLYGDGGLIMSSPDAVTWTTQTSGTTEHLYAAASNFSNLLVAVGANGTIITSPDGVTWTARNSAPGPHLYAVKYSGGTWIAVGAHGTVVRSTDGSNWTTVASGTNSDPDLRGLTFGANTAGTGMFVAVGAFGTVLTSPTGEAWSAVATPVTGSDLNAITYGTQYVAVGVGGRSFVSTDGVTWTAGSTSNQTLGAGPDLYAVARGSLRYSAVGVAGANILAR
jgi:hypothetical protein